MSSIAELLGGSIDLHVHFGPDIRERRFDVVQLAQSAKEAGMAGLLLKSHAYPTAPVAYVTSQIVPEVRLFGSLCLDHEIGGLNAEAVDVAGKLGAKVVWMPTLSSENDRIKLKRPGKGITVLDEQSRLKPEVHEILELIRKYDMVLATGHLTKLEIFAVLDAARKTGIEKLVVTHPMETRIGTALSIDEQREAVRLGAFVEHCAITLMPLGDRMDPKEVAEAVKAVGAEHCILSSDLGQIGNPGPPEGLRMAIAAVLQSGLSGEEVEKMVKTNPAQLLGIR